MKLFQIDRDSFHGMTEWILLVVLHWFIQSNLSGFSARLVIEIHDDVIQRVLVELALFTGPEAHAQDATKFCNSECLLRHSQKHMPCRGRTRCLLSQHTVRARSGERD